MIKLLRSEQKPHNLLHQNLERFHTNFTKPYSRGFSNNDLSIIAGKAAEVLLSTIKKVGQNLGKSKQVDTINNILN